MTLPAASKRVILIHPLVRELYKQALFVGLDYPLGIQKVRELWKEAIRNPIHCPSCYNTTAISTNSTTTTASSAPDTMNTKNNTRNPRSFSFSSSSSEQCEKEIRKAVGYGRRMIREMVGVIQFKKYRSMKQRYTRNNNNDTSGISGNNDKVEQYVSEENTSSSRSSSSSSSNNNNNHK